MLRLLLRRFGKERVQVGAALLSLAKPLSSVLAVVKICTMVLAPKCQGEWSDGALVYTQHRLKDRINLMR